jgi:transketolase
MAYIRVVDGHDLVAKDVLDNDRLNLGNGHAHGLLFARFSLLGVGLLG